MWRNGGILAVSGEHKVRPQKNALRRGHISPILLIPRLAYHRFFPSRANYMRDSRQHVDRPWPSNTRFRRELMPNSVRIRSFLRRGIAITGGWKSCSRTVREIRGFLGEGRGILPVLIASKRSRIAVFAPFFLLLFIFPSFIGILYTRFSEFFFLLEGRKEGRTVIPGFFSGKPQFLKRIAWNWEKLTNYLARCIVLFCLFSKCSFLFGSFFRLFYRNNNSWEFSKFICSICTVVSSKTITHFCYLLFVLIFIA